MFLIPPPLRAICFKNCTYNWRQETSKRCGCGCDRTHEEEENRPTGKRFGVSFLFCPCFPKCRFCFARFSAPPSSVSGSPYRRPGFPDDGLTAWCDGRDAVSRNRQTLLYTNLSFFCTPRFPPPSAFFVFPVHFSAPAFIPCYHVLRFILVC